MSPTCVMLAFLLAITAGYLVSRYNLSRYKITPLVIIVLLLLIVGFLALDLSRLASRLIGQCLMAVTVWIASVSPVESPSVQILNQLRCFSLESKPGIEF